MIKSFLFSLTFAGILAIITILTYHWFFNNTGMLMALMAIESLAITSNLLLVFNYFKKEYEKGIHYLQ